MNILKMKDIKIYQQHTLVTLNDWRVLITEKSPLEIFNRLKDNSVIYIEWEMHSRYSIASAREQNIDELESLIIKLEFYSLLIITNETIKNYSDS